MGSALAACASGSPGSGQDDGGARDDGGASTIDAGPPDATLGGFGDECEEHGDCKSGVCYDGHCNELCDDLCPDGYACQTVVISEGVEAELCVPAEQNFCATCETNADCGDSSDMCIELTAGRFCSVDCSDDPTICPTGFTCAIINGAGDIIIGMQCKPLNGICCVDADGDIRGDGGGCVTTDCDDTNPDVYDDAAEVCDGFDNDCVGGIDVDPVDCQTGSCMLGVTGYFERPAEPCTDAACMAQSAIMCGLYTCSDGGEAGDTCATSCDAEDDGKCVPAAHCDANLCYEDFANGLACDESSDCQSGHCQNGFCCAFGDCCQMASDCPAFGTFDPVCDSPSTCQGSRGEAVCTASYTCSTTGDVDDDSACDATTVANPCGFYLDLRCTGAVDQTPPSCPTTCDSHADCDANGFCDPATNTCVGDRPNGQTCGEDVWCQSDHCQNGFCCDGGDCCATETDCPASYTGPAMCTSAAGCQGERDVAVCLDNECGTTVGAADDSACGPGTLSNNCGSYPSVYCNGDSVQSAPECAESCTSHSECDPSAYCNALGHCTPDEPNGETCTDDVACISGHCQNGFCCASGDCCANASDCNAYDVPAVCNDQATCQGTRVEGTCSASFQCGTSTVDDDSACAGLISNDCGLYPSVACSSAMDQTSDQSSLCPMTCADDGGCDISAHCDAPSCEADTGPGGACDEPSDCDTGLHCVDGVCCNSACTGSCQACDVAGSVGTCTNVPDGLDPDLECGAISCAGFYAGWSGDTCLRKANVSAAQGVCGGDGMCRTQAEACTAQTATVSSGITCDDTCQNPTAGTCTGTTAPGCTNVNPGTQTCGLGVCQVTVPLCVSGSDNTCVPGTGSAETCNNLDDNCDGTVDNGAFGDGLEPSNSCASVRTLNEVTSDSSYQYETLTVYGSGDHDYYRIHARETDSSCACCDFWCTDEDYEMIITLTVPVGAGSYMFCTGAGSCGAVDGNCQEVLAGSSGQWIWSLDGGCPDSDSYDIYLHIYGDNAPGYECLPYTLHYNFDAGRCL